MIRSGRLLSCGSTSIPIVEVPFAVDDAGILRCKVVEKTTGKIKTAIGATKTLVQNRGLGRFAIIANGNCFEALRARITTTILYGV